MKEMLWSKDDWRKNRYIKLYFDSLKHVEGKCINKKLKA